MDNKFTPRNRVQQLAYQKRGIMSQSEFQRAIGVKPWQVRRLTARSWWLNGIAGGMRFAYIKALADFLRVTLDELTDE